MIGETLTTATRNAAFKFPQASQQALEVKNGNHLLNMETSIHDLLTNGKV